jgi:hypothetical protein
MAMINSLLVIEWRVADGRVQYVTSSPYSVYVPDNVTMTDTQTIVDYIMSQSNQEQVRLLQLARQGLLTLAPIGQAKATVPPMPPAAPAQPASPAAPQQKAS